MQLTETKKTSAELDKEINEHTAETDALDREAAELCRMCDEAALSADKVAWRKFGDQAKFLESAARSKRGRIKELEEQRPITKKREADERERGVQERAAACLREYREQALGVQPMLAALAERLKTMEKKRGAAEAELTKDGRRMTATEDTIIRSLEYRTMKRPVALAMCRVGLHNYYDPTVGDGAVASFTTLDQYVLPRVDALIRAGANGNGGAQ